MLTGSYRSADRSLNHFRVRPGVAIPEPLALRETGEAGEISDAEGTHVPE